MTTLENKILQISNMEMETIMEMEMEEPFLLVNETANHSEWY